jgi:predicted transcriptional regulator
MAKKIQAVTVRLPSRTHRKIKRAAQLNRRSMVREILVAVEERVQRQEEARA